MRYEKHADKGLLGRRDNVISVSNKARDHIKTKGGIVQIISGDKLGLCWGRINLGPSVRLGMPKDQDNYTLQRINEIDVYTPLEFYSPNPLVIVVQSLLGFKTLHIEGWKLIWEIIAKFWE